VAAAAAEARTAVVIGFAEHVSRSRVANSAALIGADGVVVGIYRKTHLFGDERRVFVAGDHLILVRLGGTLVAQLVCFDLEFPESARRLARVGAELLVTISANMAPFFGARQAGHGSLQVSGGDRVRGKPAQDSLGEDSAG
jgi:(R)-amidase